LANFFQGIYLPTAIEEYYHIDLSAQNEISKRLHPEFSFQFIMMELLNGNVVSTEKTGNAE
jgi:hypothetical protein